MENIIYSNLKFGATEGEPTTIIHYRGYELGVWIDDNGQQFYTYINDEEIGFGSFNSNFQDDLEYLVDYTLDHIYSYDDDLYGGHLDWFNNGGHRDIKLTYRLRILKVWTLSDTQRTNEQFLKQIQAEGEQLLTDYLYIDQLQ